MRFSTSGENFPKKASTVRSLAISIKFKEKKNNNNKKKLCNYPLNALKHFKNILQPYMHHHLCLLILNFKPNLWTFPSTNNAVVRSVQPFISFKPKVFMSSNFSREINYLQCQLSTLF